MEESKIYSIKGLITNLKKEPIAGLTIRAYDKDFGTSKDLLGEAAITDEKGEYLIEYVEADFRRSKKEKGGADVKIMVYNAFDRLLAESKLMADAKQHITISLQVDDSPIPVEKPVLLFHKDLGKSQKLKDSFEQLFQEKGGDWSKMEPDLTEEKGFSPSVLKKLRFTHDLNRISNTNVPLVQAFQGDRNINSLRDAALRLNRQQLREKLVKVKAVPDGVREEVYAAEVHARIFQEQPTPFLQRMLADADETPIAAKTVSANMALFLENQGETFDIRKHSVYAAFEQEEAFKGIDDGQQQEVREGLKTVQRVLAVSPVPEAMGVLIQADMTSAFRISEMPEAQFVRSLASRLGDNGERVAKQIHASAVNARIRNEQALMALHDAHQATGLAAVDESLRLRRKPAKEAVVMAKAAKGMVYEEEVVVVGPQEVTQEYLQQHNLSWDLLFGDADFCECGHCNSVYSPAAYFVDLLQYLRNNNLEAGKINSDPKSIAGTPLEHLFQRRPDLGCLQLTCTNTNTVLPYVDLVNEVMENYIVYHKPKAFNVEDETSGELLAQPQNIEYDAYCILQKAVNPFDLPYHQPIDATRIFLKFLETSRKELIDRFRSPRKKRIEPVDAVEPAEADPQDPATAEEQAELDALHELYLQRAVDAECLGLTQEEYVILTKEAFVSKAYWDKQCDKVHSTEEYQEKIGLKPVHEYYGYASAAAMLNTDEILKEGLPFVKDQFLPRTGVTYVDLVELLKTRFLNPNMPQGRALAILEGIQFSYRFLQTLVNAKASSKKAKYEKLIEFLNTAQALLPLLDLLLNPDPCQPMKVDECLALKDLEHWVYCYFEKIGKIIVLENGCAYPSGRLMLGNIGKVGAMTKGMQSSFLPVKNCEILYVDGKEVVGHINRVTGEITLVEKYEEGYDELHNLVFVGDQGERGVIRKNFLVNEQTGLPFCFAQRDNCDLDSVRLVHLDGTEVTPAEYDRIHRFIRLWRRLGWSIHELDQAILGLGKEDAACRDDLLPAAEDCHDDLLPISKAKGGKADGAKLDCPDLTVPCDITADFLHQLVAVKELLEKTGLDLVKLLTFWAPIGTSGEKPLYQRLFLRHNIQSIDEVFRSDKNGQFLTQEAKISDHLPVLRAAFNLKGEDVVQIMEESGMEDLLTLENVSKIYRYRLLAKVIGERIPAFLEVLELFGSIFESSHKTLWFLKQWERMEEAGFDFQQLNYVIRQVDNPKRPFAPNQRMVLQLAKSLYDGLNAIQDAHPETDPNLLVTAEMIRSKASLLFDQVLVEEILGLLEGTSTYTTNAPKDLEITLPESDSLYAKLIYDPVAGSIQLMGRLTAAETTTFKALTGEPAWSEALDRIEKQQQKHFREVLANIFDQQKLDLDKRPTVEAAEELILSGDVKVPLDTLPAGADDPNTAPQKRFHFLLVFLPYLRQRLRQRFIVDTLVGLTGMEESVVEALIMRVLVLGDPLKPIYYTFESVRYIPKPGENGWSGFLIPNAEEQYTFVVNDSDTSPKLSIDGQPLIFQQQEDPTNEWWSLPISLQAGKVYAFEVDELPADLSTLRWKTSTSAFAPIPASALLPDYATSDTAEALSRLLQVGITVDGFNLSADELLFFQAFSASFNNLNFNALTREQWFRLEAYTRLRNSLPEAKYNLLDFFQWTHDPDDPALLSQYIADTTLWEQKQVEQLIAANHFDLLDPADFQNEINLLKLQKALQLADKVNMDIDLLFEWAIPTSHFATTHRIAESIRQSIRSLYRQEDWEQVVKPLNDQLRENQKNALISYLLVQSELMDWGVTDADGLFEYFLIDVQMDPCMLTSRIKQAISAVQLFVQRCFLGLEAPTVSNQALDRGRWDWMQRYRVWEANRKVFLYPENWIESNLRDDKSPFFLELESELLQNDINPQTVEEALKAYLYKLDEVANMEVLGFYIENELDEAGEYTDQPIKLHLVSRTRNTPYFFYYRYYDIKAHEWYPWGKMQIDIPSYDVLAPSPNPNNRAQDNGCYVVPVVWNRRILVFFPQCIKKTVPRNLGSKITTSKDDGGNLEVPITAPTEQWEVKMAWSEYRNGKWTQKQLSSDSIATSPIDSTHDIQFFKFIPAVHPTHVYISIDDLKDNDNKFYKTFRFTGNKLVLHSKVDPVNASAGQTFPIVYFHRDSSRNMFSWQLRNGQRENTSLSFRDLTGSDPRTTIANFYEASNSSFYHSFIGDLLGRINLGRLQSLFAYNLSVTDVGEAFGAYQQIFHELKRPYSLYNWELWFHTPVMLANALSEAQQFEAAMKWYHFVFNPMADGTDAKRFWQYLPFKELDAQNILDSIFSQLQPNQADAYISAWRDKPFLPHLVARNRPVAYMKWVVSKYLDNLIAWGDYLFRQDTIETLNQATQLYVLASHILGPKPQFIPKRGKIRPQTYLSLLDKWDAFSNAMVELELAAPYSNQTPLPIGFENGTIGLANIFGFSTTLYFCIPNNPKLLAYWDTIADRLYKIRHCLNIQGVFRQLPLFEPPIDPALLVQAAAQGLSLDAVLNDLNTPLPNYRFYYLLQKALELCNEVKSVGNTLLSTLEKKDNEGLAVLRARHDSNMNNLVMEVRKQQLEEATKSLESLYENRKAPEHRMRYYLQLAGEDAESLPGADADFTELVNAIEAPIDESGLKINRFEKEDLVKASEAKDWQIAVGVAEVIGGILSIIPSFSVDGKPLGVGAGISFGGSNLGSAASAVARGLQVRVNELNFESGRAVKKGGFLRALQDRLMQANNAGYEIKQIDKQILTQQIRIEMANQEIANQQQSIDNAAEVEDFLKSKYTNEELYTWMKANLRTQYYQLYSLAYEIAKKAEKVYRFERGISSSNFIQAGYWNAGRDGLLAGEQLYVALKQLESAYQEQRGHDYELTKHVSLRNINPLALMQLRETGSCEFDLIETLFDMDFPGHYQRRIKSVSLSIPCVVGPYTSINASLRLLVHKFRNSSIAKDGKAYLENTEEMDDRFSTNHIPIDAIAVSSAQDDSGMFELSFNGERYLPFEGAGVISSWRLELPSAVRQFDYHTISDVIVHLRYTAVEGGERLKLAATSALQDFFASTDDLGQEEGVFGVIDLKHDLPNEWNRTFHNPPADGQRIFDLTKVGEFLPYFARYKNGQIRDARDLEVTDLVLSLQSDLKAGELTFREAGNELAFTDGLPLGNSNSFVIRDEALQLDQWSIAISKLDAQVERGWLVFRMALK